MFSEFIMVRISPDLNSAQLNFYPNKVNNYFLNKVWFHPVYLE